MAQVKNEKKRSVRTNTGQARRVRILVVEDSKNLRSVSAAMLCDMGFEVTHAENGL
jgi:response regulator RpfG family c-di-GMP phosphodiesterase